MSPDINDEKSFRKEKSYEFTGIFNENCSNSHVFDTLVSPLLSKIFSGLNGTFFAYGSTGILRIFLILNK